MVEGLGQLVRQAADTQSVLQIEYSDAKGDITFREVIPVSPVNKGPWFEAWCTLRQANRRFFWRNVLSAKVKAQ